MAKGSKRGRKKRKAPASGPSVHVKLAYVDTDLHGASSLAKPALLYADRVTIYSPAASMLTAARNLASISEPRAQALAAMELIEEVPSLSEQLKVDPSVLQNLRTFLSLSPRTVRRRATRIGARSEIDDLYKQLEGISEIWAKDLPQGLADITSQIGAEELTVAIDAGAVEVAELGAEGVSSIIADSIRAAEGDHGGDTFDQLMAGFIARVVQMLTEERTLPLLDASSSEMVRALENETGLRPSTRSMKRGAEVRSAADFMGFLPYFVDLPMDEVLDLRQRLKAPLVRFRGEMTTLARGFEVRPIDSAFAVEVEDAWRERVEPALADIRESLAEHGLLREVRSVALGDPRRLLVEAGGVLAAAHGELLSLSGLMSAVAAVGVPAADVIARALREVWSTRGNVRRSAFYFLHRLAEEARSRS